MSEHHVAVIGAGPAGVSVALSLHDHGVRPLLIDRADDGRVPPGAAATTGSSSIPADRSRTCRTARTPRGRRCSRRRDQVVAHLDRHAHEDGIELRLGTTVDRIDREPGGWRLRTSTGDIDARQVVVATGNQHTPAVPEVARDGRLHRRAAALVDSTATPSRTQGKKVLVVGCRLVGNGDRARPRDRRGGQGLDGGPDAAEHHAALASRRSARRCDRPAAVPRADPASPTRSAGRARRADLGDLSEFGLPMPDEGVFAGVARLDTGAGAGRHGRHRRDQGRVDRGGRDRRSIRRRQGRRWSTVAGWTRTPSSVRPATDAGWNRWSATSACSTREGQAGRQRRTPAAGRAALHRLHVRPSFIGYVAKQSKRMAKRGSPAELVSRLE